MTRKLDYPGPWPPGSSWAAFKFTRVIRRERRLGRTNRYGTRFVTYIAEHKGRLGPTLEVADPSEYEVVGVFFRRSDAEAAGHERIAELAADPANWTTGCYLQTRGHHIVHRFNHDDRCPGCGATRAEIEGRGHHMLDSMGRPAFVDSANVLPCPEACTCIPQHFSMAEHCLAEPNSPSRCQHMRRADGTGPQCCREAGHVGECRYRCASPDCPGLPIPASEHPHPPDCGASGRGLCKVAILLALLGLPGCFQDTGDNGGPTTGDTGSSATGTTTESQTTTSEPDPGASSGEATGGGSGSESTTIGTSSTTSSLVACHPLCGDTSDCEGQDHCINGPDGRRCYPPACLNCFGDNLACCTDDVFCAYQGCEPCG